jgi:hypothetical protein
MVRQTVRPDKFLLFNSLTNFWTAFRTSSNFNQIAENFGFLSREEFEALRRNLVRFSSDAHLTRGSQTNQFCLQSTRRFASSTVSEESDFQSMNILLIKFSDSAASQFTFEFAYPLRVHPQSGKSIPLPISPTGIPPAEAS